MNESTSHGKKNRMEEDLHWNRGHGRAFVTQQRKWRKRRN